ncbi:MAG: asparagine synthase (glutamine-hydrolyzing) [Flavobacteriales bacterium]|nr:asparagine synthase (glutamine-hydrolyzing) [Flavobacteriales bacterium]
MCGILGFIGNEMPSVEKFENALNKISHRGPDNIEYNQIDNKCILGHTRLSIIDLESRSNQPFQIGDYFITYNGEIFNFIELKTQLQENGYVFKTKSDTEVLLYSYIHWDEKCVEKFNGMWAFCIYNKKNKKAFLSRDRFGVKPLRYYYKDKNLIFASESKAILPLVNHKVKPNIEKIINFIKESEGCFSTSTWFDDIYNLLPGHNAIFCNGELNSYQYFKSPVKKSLSSNSKIFLKKLKNAINLRLISDVPIGYTLSSGLDSTSIVALAKSNEDDLVTYTAGFRSIESEHKLVEKFTNEYKIKNKIIYNEFKDEKAIHKLVYHLESGHGSPAILPLFSLYDKISKDRIKVVIEGQGADELLAGYVSPNYIPFLFSKFMSLNFKDIIRILKSKKDFTKSEALSKYFRSALLPFIRDLIFFFKNKNLLNVKYFFTKREKRLYLKSSNYFSNYLNRQHSQTLTNLLHYGDAISMAYSIESRVPFLDINFINYCSNLIEDCKMGIYDNKFVGKLLFRKEMESILPDYILHNKKKGFTTPVHRIINSDWAKSFLCNLRHIKSHSILSLSSINKIEKNKSQFSENILFRILITEVWFKNFYE